MDHLVGDYKRDERIVRIHDTHVMYTKDYSRLFLL